MVTHLSAGIHDGRAKNYRQFAALQFKNALYDVITTRLDKTAGLRLALNRFVP
jgi:hypothetical protein